MLHVCNEVKNKECLEQCENSVCVCKKLNLALLAEPILSLTADQLAQTETDDHRSFCAVNVFSEL